MIDLTQEVIDHGGTGVVYWEPAWVAQDVGHNMGMALTGRMLLF
jgi:arabinogalactan endo-1,4-beta-galactosidase